MGASSQGHPSVVTRALSGHSSPHVRCATERDQAAETGRPHCVTFVPVLIGICGKSNSLRTAQEIQYRANCWT